MRKLTPADPSRIGDHLLLRRLGAGGMGVVYLARAPGGALVALKLVRAEYADEPGFRRRFRREVQLASRLRGRWLVPVTAADPHAPEPWLATAYVAGPALGGFLAEHGALPPPTVRVLGARLAEALAEVHAAGLVHRDVKPDNVLLSLDGPRLIDFGIARDATGATPLTASGVVVGSPGYLSPEQAQARAGEIGPASDVFSLGCVLAHAAGGRAPFGGGNAPGVLYRTVHDAPDLADVPAPLVGLVRACLAKNPEDRPDARAVRARLTDPRNPAGADPGDGWPPPPLPRLVAERAARVLDVLPDAATRVDEGAPPPEPPAGSARTRPSRRRLVALLGAATGVAALGGGAALLVRAAGRGDDAPGGALPRYTVGMHADLSGRDRADGEAQERGARLAVTEHNARPDRAFDLALDVHDDGGDAGHAAEVAERLSERSVVAVLGPTTDAATEAAVPVYDAGGVPTVTVSAATSAVTEQDHDTFFRLRPSDSGYATAVLHHLTAEEPSARTAAIDDQAASLAVRTLAGSLAIVPPSDGTTVRIAAAADDAEDFTGAAGEVLAADADAVVFVGDAPERAARCARALHDAGFRGPRVAVEPVMTPDFRTAAGTGGEGWVLVATHADPDAHPEAAEFAAAYRDHFDTDEVPRYAAEAYDALRFVAAGLVGVTGGDADAPDAELRSRLRRGLRGLTHEGVTRTITFHPHSRAYPPGSGTFRYRLEDGRWRYLGSP